MKTLLISLVAAVAVPAAALAAQPAAAPVPQRLHGPANAAHVQTRAEVVAHIRTMFGRLDSNRDNFLTRAEMQAARSQKRQKPQGAKTQRGGVAGARAFERFDLNRDGAISRAEWDAHAAQRQQRRAATGGRGEGARGVRHAGMGMGGRMFQTADVDRDNRLSFAEAQNAALQHFDRADLNRDGSLTPEERRQAREAMKAQHRRS